MENPGAELAPTQQQNTSDQAPKPTVVQAVEKATQLTAHAEFFSGPIPHPALLEEYERVCPGSCEKIFKMAMDEQSHRHSVDQKTIDFEERQIKRGQWFGFGIAIATLIAAVTIVLRGDSTTHSIVGSFIGVGGLASIAGAFVYSRGREKTSKDDADKKKASD
jgi:uncharacterized membrane protein